MRGEPSPVVFRVIQAAAFVLYAGVFGGPLAYLFVDRGESALAAIIVGGVLVLIGAALCATSAPRIYDPTRVVNQGVYEEGYQSQDGREVHVKRQVGSEQVTYSKTQAVKMTRNSVIFGVIGVAVAWLLSYLLG